MKSKLIFYLSLLTAFIIVMGRTINVYQYALVGAIFELLWLPAIAGIFVLLVWAFVNWGKEKFVLKSFSFYSMLIIVVSMGFTFCLK